MYLTFLVSRNPDWIFLNGIDYLLFEWFLQLLPAFDLLALNDVLLKDGEYILTSFALNFQYLDEGLE